MRRVRTIGCGDVSVSRVFTLLVVALALLPWPAPAGEPAEPGIGAR